EGEGAVHAVGSRGPGLTVEITDEVGRPVSGAVVSVRLPDDGPGGVFANGMTNEIVVTGSDGRATTRPIRWNHIPGQVQIKITAVRDRLRAGAVVSQYLSGPDGRGAFTSAPAAMRSNGRSKWLKVALIAAAAAGAGFTVGIATRGEKSANSPPSSPPVEIGPPTIIVTKP
ncbi:MAG TPA: hypothetical protein PLK67_00935, partial [Bryobacteraceae bacterium]|nr:hypothetical protein [Bryobacteraceae bacterium]